MNAKLLFKTIFLLLILLLIVAMGLYNRNHVSFTLPPLIQKSVTLPAAIMYFSFWALGVLTGTVLTAGGKKGSSSGAGKPKSGK